MASPDAAGLPPGAAPAAPAGACPAVSEAVGLADFAAAARFPAAVPPFWAAGGPDPPAPRGFVGAGGRLLLVLGG